MIMDEGRDRQLWAHTSSVLSLIANVNRNPKKSRAMRPADFNPWLACGDSGGNRIPIRADNIAVLKNLL